MSSSWYPVIDTDRCTECGVCVEFCKHGVYDKGAAKPMVIGPEHCVEGCHGCQSKCAAEAITYFGEGTVKATDTCSCECSCNNDKATLNPVAVRNLLPQLDCNKCGYATCHEFAESLIKGDSEPEDCTPLMNPRFTQALFKLQKVMEGR